MEKVEIQVTAKKQVKPRKKNRIKIGAKKIVIPEKEKRDYGSKAQ